jgi:hypothetical protein
MNWMSKAMVVALVVGFQAPTSIAGTITFTENGEMIKGDFGNLVNGMCALDKMIPELMTCTGTTAKGDMIDPGQGVQIILGDSIGEKGTKVGEKGLISDIILVSITGNGNGTSQVMVDFQSDSEDNLPMGTINDVETGMLQIANLQEVKGKKPANFDVKFQSEVPEPSSLSILAPWLVGFAAFGRRMFWR